MRVAFALLHSNDTALRGHSSCSSAVPNRPVEAALAPLEGAVGSLQAAIGKLQGTEGRWLWWCCLDILRLSVSGILQQLLAAPQDAGAGNLSTNHETICPLAKGCTPSSTWYGAVWPRGELLGMVCPTA